MTEELKDVVLSNPNCNFEFASENMHCNEERSISLSVGHLSLLPLPLPPSHILSSHHISFVKTYLDICVWFSGASSPEMVLKRDEEKEKKEKKEKQINQMDPFLIRLPPLHRPSPLVPSFSCYLSLYTLLPQIIAGGC